MYSSDENKLQKEAEAAQKLGIGASLERQIEIPVSCAGAVRFPNQAQFHPLKFINALSQQLSVYENTMVTGVDGHLVKTVHGSVNADKIPYIGVYAKSRPNWFVATGFRKWG